MKGLALNIVFGLIIALVGVVLLISLVTGNFQSAANWFYCNVYVNIGSFFSGQETASVPENCRQNIDNNLKVEEIREQDNQIFSRELLSYIIACWKDAEIKKLYETHPCYELYLMKDVNNVTEENVSSILVNEDHCKSIENSDYGCGSKNQILWNIGGDVISNQKIILIRYDNSTEGIMVIG